MVVETVLLFAVKLAAYAVMLIVGFGMAVLTMALMAGGSKAPNPAPKGQPNPSASSLPPAPPPPPRKR